MSMAGPDDTQSDIRSITEKNHPCDDSTKSAIRSVTEKNHPCGTTDAQRQIRNISSNPKPTHKIQ
jgi:hypothetical protein